MTTTQTKGTTMTKPNEPNELEPAEDWIDYIFGLLFVLLS